MKFFNSINEWVFHCRLIHDSHFYY